MNRVDQGGGLGMRHVAVIKTGCTVYLSYFWVLNHDPIFQNISVFFLILSVIWGIFVDLYRVYRIPQSSSPSPPPRPLADPIKNPPSTISHPHVFIHIRICACPCPCFIRKRARDLSTGPRQLLLHVNTSDGARFLFSCTRRSSKARRSESESVRFLSILTSF